MVLYEVNSEKAPAGRTFHCSLFTLHLSTSAEGFSLFTFRFSLRPKGDYLLSIHDVDALLRSGEALAREVIDGSILDATDGYVLDARWVAACIFTLFPRAFITIHGSPPSALGYSHLHRCTDIAVVLAAIDIKLLVFNVVYRKTVDKFIHLGPLDLVVVTP